MVSQDWHSYTVFKNIPPPTTRTRRVAVIVAAIMAQYSGKHHTGSGRCPFFSIPQKTVDVSSRYVESIQSDDVDKHMCASFVSSADNTTRSYHSRGSLLGALEAKSLCDVIPVSLGLGCRL